VVLGAARTHGASARRPQHSAPAGALAHRNAFRMRGRRSPNTRPRVPR